MLQLGNRPLTFTKARDILTKPQNVLDKPAVQAKGGEGYLFRSADEPGRQDYRCDQYRFIHSGNYCDHKSGVYKRYYQVKDPDGKLKQSLPGFKRHVYSLISDERDSESTTITYLIHYIGDSTLHKDSAHGNAKKKKDSVFVHTSRTCLEEIKKDEKNTPKQTYTKLQSEGMRQEDQSRMPTDRPRDVKQCENLKYTKRQSLRLSKDTIFNALEMSDHTDDFVRMIQVYPDVTIHMAHSEMLEETRNILKISMANTELPQVISYDTTFSLGDFYVSVLVCRNVLLVGNPIFPVAFMVHEKKFMKNHEQMLRDILHCLGVDKCSNIPIVTDREKGITKPLHDFFPDLPKFFCLNHILKDVERWLHKNSAKRHEIGILLGDIRKLVLSDGENQFNERYHNLANGWPVKFRVYFDKHIKNDIARNTCRFRSKHFSAFSEGPPTNNISESMNKVLKAASGHKEMTVDAIILWFHQMQTNYLNDFRRAESGHGEYVLKTEFSHMRRHHRDVQYPRLISLDDIRQDIDTKENMTKFYMASDKANERFAQRAMARWCVKNGMVGFSSTTGAFTVASMTQRKIHCVRYHPKPPSCTCASTAICYHILAVAMALRDNNPQKEIPSSLSQLLKNRKGTTRKSGRKKPRRGDFDYAVSKPLDNSTPKKQQQAFDVSMMSDEQLSDINDEIMPLDLTTDSIHDKSGKLHIPTNYPWLSPMLMDKNPQHVARRNLQPEEWLDDDTIERAIQAFCIEKPGIVFFNLFCYRYAEKNLATTPLCKFAHRREAANKDLFLVLVHVKDHWILGVVNLNRKTVLVMDSQISNSRNYEDIFRNIFKIINASFMVANVTCKLDNWKFALCMDVHQQENTFDCGIHVIANAYCVANDLPLPCDLPSGVCRIWVDDLAVNWPQPLQKLKLPSELPKEIHGSVLEHWKLTAKSVVAYSKLADSSSENTIRNKSKWDNCDSSFCDGGKSEDKQILCVQCRKWYHESCLAIDNNADEMIYFICYQNDCSAESCSL